MADNILGAIPARGGSKEIPRKNLLKLGDRTLLELAIDSAGESTLLTRSIVSTEDDELAEVARAAGAEVPFERPAELATDDAATLPVIRHAVAWLEDNEGWRADIVVILQPNTPFRRGAHIDDTVRLLLDRNIGSAMTVRKTDYPPHWMLHMDDGGRLTRLLEDGGEFSRRQDTPPVYQPNGLVYALTYDKLMAGTALPDTDTHGVLMDEADSVNIDTWAQYQLARALWEEREGGA